jgi:cephalosporin hydroxylase
MGTNNPDVVSNMGAFGKPGASLRAFRDFLPNAKVYGADIDRRILFTEDRIETFFVDQTEPAAFVELDKSIPSDLDLIIDDGLHSPNANIYTMQFALPKIKVGGWFVIEDIALQALPVWEVVAALLPDRYEPYIYRAASTIVFAVKRIY